MHATGIKYVCIEKLIAFIPLASSAKMNRVQFNRATPGEGDKSRAGRKKICPNNENLFIIFFRVQQQIQKKNYI